MARGLHRLTARQVSTITKVGRHADGGGLYLRLTTAGSRSWVFMYVMNGKRIEIGLGSAKALSLAAVRLVAAEMREKHATGRDPRRVLTAASSAPQAAPPFGRFAEQYIDDVEAGWKSPVHRQQWRTTLRDHAFGLSEMPLDMVDTDAVLAVLRPIWLSKPETASRLRGRIEKVLDAAKARGFRSKDSVNPAAWRGHLALLLPTQTKLIRGHHRALPFDQAPTFMSALREREAPAARCLEFTILTAARSGETLGATWREIDLERELWTVPAARMKAGAEHVVPLSRAALSVLETVRASDVEPATRIFSVSGVARSNMAMTMLLRRMKAEATVHGFRSTFRDWAGDTTSHPRELVEQALAHTISSKAERAYRRGTAVQRRRGLMEEWARFLDDTGRPGDRDRDFESLSILAPTTSGSS